MTASAMRAFGVLLFLIGSLLQFQPSWAASQSRTASAVVCSTLGGGGANWTTPANASFSDNVYASTSVDGTISDPLQCIGYGFSIPATATILGIQVNIERKSNSTANGGSRDNSLFLVKGGVAGTTNRATATAYTTADAVESHGSATDLWGTTWTPANINAANFGAVFTATKPSGAGGAQTVTVDQIEIVVFYTTATQTKASGGCTTLGGGGVNWTTPANAALSDNAYASANVDGTVTDPLQCLDYSFSVPAGATIVGIEVNIQRKSSSTANGGSRDNSLFMVKGGVAETTNRATATTYTTTDTNETHGGPTDLWGTAWTPADINAPDFGAVFTATKPSGAGGAQTVTVDQIQITVYYSQPPPNLLAPADSAILTSGSPAFDWSDVVDPDGAAITYDMQADTANGTADCTFSSPEFNSPGLSVSAVTPGAALADGTYCWRARAVDSIAGAWSTTRTVTINTVGSFNAAENGAANGTTLRTKLAGTSFSLDILAIKAGSVFTGYRGTVSIELVDGSSSGVCGSMTQLLANGNLTFGAADSGRKSTSITFSSAVPNARIRISDTSVGVTACSTDNFTIRPTGFSSVTSNMTNAGTTGTPLAKAGDAFTITTVAGSGYSGTPTIDNTKVTAHAGSAQNGAVSGSFAAANAATGTASGSSFTYSEVGTFTLGANAVVDSTFVNGSADLANGDCVSGSFSNVLSGGLYGCNIGNGTASAAIGRFKPDHFVLVAGSTLTNRQASGCSPASSFTYEGETFALGFTLSAVNSSSAVTKNYQGTFAKLNLGTLAALGLGARSGATNLTGRLDTSVAPVGSFAAGQAGLTAILALTRSALDGPFTSAAIGIAPNDADPDAAGGTQLLSAALNLDVDGVGGNDHQQAGASTEFRFGRLRMQNALASSAALTLPVPLETQYWTGATFTTNSADSCTSLIRDNIALSNYTASLNACETRVNQGTVSFSNGVGTLTLSAPAAGNEGAVLLTPNLGVAASGNFCPTVGGAQSAAVGANRAYLQGAWTGMSFTENPAAQAIFGLFGSQPRNFIFQRENY